VEYLLVSSGHSAPPAADPRTQVPGTLGVLPDQNVGVTIPGEDSSRRARIVAALLRDGDQVLLCHRCASRRWYPGVWDLPGGHAEEAERPGAALVRELREELGIMITEPLGSPIQEIRAATFDMQMWLVEVWTGTPVNAAPDEHDAIAWFDAGQLADLPLAHDSYLTTFIWALTGRHG